MQLIDTHTHLYSEQFDNDRDQMIERAIAKGIEKFFLPNIDGSSIEGMNALTNQFPGNCYAMIGLHPCSVDSNYEKELELIEKELSSQNHYVGIGEIGIDLYWEKAFLKEQEIAFRQQILWAKEKELPIAIHCREAFDEILHILDELNDDRLSGIFHCFTGTYDQAQHILNYGNFKLGIGGVVTFKNAGLDKVVQQLSLEDLVLETDAPYLAPSPYRGKRNESSYLIEVAEKVSELKEMPLEEVAEITSNNALSLFKTHD